VEPQVCVSFSTVIELVYILGATCAPAVVLRVKSRGLLRIVGWVAVEGWADVCVRCTHPRVACMHTPGLRQA
jgi:hypothetical protein